MFIREGYNNSYKTKYLEKMFKIKNLIKIYIYIVYMNNIFK